MYGRFVTPVALLACLGGAVPSCKSNEHPPAYAADGGSGGNDSGIQIGVGGATDLSTAPPEDLSKLCGSQLLPIITERPNLYLILDRSGSMDDGMLEEPTVNDPTKYEASVQALHDVLFAIGHRVAYGAAVFPSFGNLEDCSAGSSIDRVKVGDSVTYARNGLDGPHLKSLMKTLKTYRPIGGTPTSATLEKLLPTLLALDGKTSVILTTDGAPNCNAEATCEATSCIANIENALQLSGKACDATVNCCAETGDYGPYSCIDTDATVAPIAELLGHGIKTYVIGLPGSDAYQDTMNQLAVAGGTAREQSTEAEPKYYRAEDSEALTKALKTIAADLSISCTISLEKVPPDWSQVNVYFDDDAIIYNEKNGWKKVDDQTIELVGSRCSELSSGDVFQVQVTFGCATVTIQ